MLSQYDAQHSLLKSFLIEKEKQYRINPIHQTPSSLISNNNKPIATQRTASFKPKTADDDEPILTLNDKDREEPEMPLTGYNYAKYFNESNLMMRTTKSAHKI